MHECPACKAPMQNGSTELTFKRDRSVVVIEEIPALVCQQCGEASIEETVAQKAYEIAEVEINRGVALEFCKFKVA